MADATNLRNTLISTENSAPAIQSSSRAMMRFYDRPSGPSLAVSEWRSVLQTSHVTQMLPLLYVANEVLQTSKRNRGNKFLEAFSPVLGSSLQYICQRDQNVVEKVRRTVKIWGDRRIFSMRFVLDILGGLDSFRGGASSAINTATNTGGLSTAQPTLDPFENNPPRRHPSKSSNSDDEDDFLGGASDGEKLLDVDVSIGSTSFSAVSTRESSSGFGSGAKRRRSSTSPTLHSSTSAPASSKKSKVLSSQTFLELFQSIVDIDEKYKSSLGVLDSIPHSYLEESISDIDDLVGDELTDMYKKVCETQRNIRRERRIMYNVALQKRELETEAKKYIQWLKNLAKIDDEEIEFCNRLEKKLDVLTVFHAEAREIREKRRDEETRKKAEEEASARRMAEEEERRRLLDDVKKEGEAKPGMVWNKQLREYQYLHDPTNESWRD